MMKRSRFGGGEEVESVNMANVLVLISRGGETDQSERPPPPPSRVFECKTCSRRFLSFQALGGHRASHKKPRVGGEGEGMKPKAHECSICGLEFGIGQALGGHMRRHRAAATVAAGGFRQGVGAKKGDGRRGAWLDLNLPPLDENEMECLEMGFGLETVDKIRFIDCFH